MKGVAYAVVRFDPPAVYLAEDIDVLHRVLALELVADTDPALLTTEGADELRNTLLEERWADAVVSWMELSGVAVEVVPVENRFFGPTVTVSGLLTGRDVIEALRERDLGDVVFLPRAMFDASGELTLDDISPAAIGERLGARVEVAGTMGEVIDLLCV